MWIEGSIPSFSYSYIIHYITTILYSTPHIHKPTHIYSPDPNKTTSPFILYKCVDITLLQNQNYIFIFSYHTHYYFLPNIYILSYLLLITTTIYIPTYNQKYTTILDIYLTYTIITYLLTLKNRTHLSIHLFHPTILFIHTLTYIQYILYIPLLLHHYYFIILWTYYMYICTYIHIYIPVSYTHLTLPTIYSV